MKKRLIILFILIIFIFAISRFTPAEQTLQDTTTILENLPQYTEILDEAKTNIQTAQNTLDKTEEQLKEIQKDNK